MTPLGVLPGDLDSAASAINDAGVAGRPIEQLPGGALHPGPLGRRNHHRPAAAAGCDERRRRGHQREGTIVGNASGPIGSNPQPVIWEGGRAVPLGSDWGAVAGSAWGINNRGEVVGMTFEISGFVWLRRDLSRRSHRPTARSRRTSASAVWRSATSSRQVVPAPRRSLAEGIHPGVSQLTAGR